MATEPLAGRRLTKVTERKTRTDWVRFLPDIDECYADATRITLVMDNLNTYRPGALYEIFEPAEAKALRDRFEFVYTPKHGSWLNVAERPHQSQGQLAIHHGRRTYQAQAPLSDV